MSKRFGLLTEYQVRILKLRSKGLSLRKVASILNTSHQNIALTEKRALENVKIAEQTILAYKLITSPIKLVLSEGMKLIDIPRLIIEEADKVGIKVRADFTLIFKLLRFKAGVCIRVNRIERPILIIVDKNGYVDVYPYHEVQGVFNDIEKI